MNNLKAINLTIVLINKLANTNIVNDLYGLKKHMEDIEMVKW